MPAIPIPMLRERAAGKLVSVGVGRAEAEIIVDHMLTADLCGRPTHGLSLRFPYILRHAQAGAAKRTPAVVRDRGHLVVLDGRDGFGFLTGHRGTEILIERAKQHGSATVAMQNAGYTGFLGHYVDKAARADLVAMAFGNCSPLMAPYGGTRALLGTNPIALAFPAQPDPVLVDMATSKISYGELMALEAKGMPLPPGCALDSQGRPTTDPAAARSGALLPFGEHKGGALALAVQILAGPFTGCVPVPTAWRGYGLLLVGYALDAFTDRERYFASMKELLDAYLAVPPAPGQELRVPGWRRYENRRTKKDMALDVSDELAGCLSLNA